MDIKAILKTNKKKALTFLTLAVMCGLSLLLGSSPKEVFDCAVTFNPISTECKVMFDADLTTAPVVVPTPEDGQTAPVITPVS